MLRNLGIIALVTVMVLVCSQLTLAQTGLGANQNITASAVIYTPLGIASFSPFTFGNIKLGGNPIVAPHDGAATSIISGSSVGGMVVTGSAAAKVLFTWTNQITLNHGSDVLKYTPDVNGGDAGAQGSAVQLTSGATAVTLTGGSCQVWVGGKLFEGVLGTGVVPLGQASGTYSGTLNLAVDYYQ